MSNPLRIVIAVVVLGLAAAGIAVKTANRSQTDKETSSALAAKSGKARAEAAEAPKASGEDVMAPAGKPSDLTCENTEGVCGPEVEVCELPETERQSQSESPKDQSGTRAAEAKETQPQQKAQEQTAVQVKKLPKVVDLGRGTCIPCKKMLPILKELQTEYKGRAVIQIIDLREQPEAAAAYDLRLIPTQIFFDSDGKEVWRHEGFLAKEEIEKKLKELGAD